MNQLYAPLMLDGDRQYFEAKYDLQKAIQSFKKLYLDQQSRLLQEVAAEECVKLFFSQMYPYWGQYQRMDCNAIY